ncbi:response regulator transcription factor [Hydrogenophaga laconesensis]|uniref:DNA-binding NarL/FixJ family response regulator n=1 Tax=Hydrogenophaga laconesensis TaxID=1805971 RepID=A0ABU1VHQ9_9BURK|nr:response regulator transcription factor [Hydrogenophaga laconesensis]MDR7096703.1 DNA-binding NarL/FixJ family response regulator [Hydrogenophaga laconesensis]
MNTPVPASAAAASAPFEILVIEDHPMMIHSIHASVQALRPDVHANAGVMTVCTLAQARKRFLRRDPPALIITDLNLPDSRGLDTLRTLRALAPGVPVIVFSAADERTTERAALELGAGAFVSKSALPQRFLQKIRPFLMNHMPATAPAASAGACHAPHPIEQLTERQRTVLAEAAAGHRDREIALRMKIGEQTVRTHLSVIYQRLGVQNRTQASMQYMAWAKAHDVVV